MKLNSQRRLGAVAVVSLLTAFAGISCSSDDGPSGSGGSSGSGGTGASGGTAGTGGVGGVPQPQPGEQCFDPEASQVKLRVSPKSLVLAPGQTRALEVTVDPDICDVRTMKFESSDAAVVAAPADSRIDLVTPTAKVMITGSAAGKATIKALFPTGDGDVTIDVPVNVISADIPDCSGSGAGKVDDGVSVSGTGGLALASVGYPTNATMPNKNSFIWSVAAFDATIACAPDQVPSGFTKLGPAVAFGPSDKKFPREIPFSIPINPAAMPDMARMRHVTVSYTGPNVNTPRAVPIADPRIVPDGDGYKLEFQAPWLGTYQAIAKTDGGTVTKTRRITHRAIVGVSMGGGGTAMSGFRNHEKFDVLAPLGGPVEWTWLLGHIRHNHIAGFLPNDGTTVPTGFPEFPETKLPYEHPSSFNRWWYEYPKNGNGGSFPRAEYVQIFRDLALMFGNPGSYNSTPGAENLPAGVSPDDPSVVGDRTDRECAVWVDPIGDHPDEAHQKELEQQCPAQRCANTLRLTNYFDHDFNPNGTFPVITFCDGSPQQADLTPYANTWSDQSNNKPMELALAVDYNDNGVRDENEPVIFQGHERYEDLGTDGLANVDEPGYQAGVNEDPNGDDWNPQYNPTGTEGNLRYDEGEPYEDYGLDGVQGTASSPFDFGEGNGKFDMSPGYKAFLERDSRTVISQDPLGTQKEAFDDAALARMDLWTDGGTRDLFNFAVSAQAMMGSWAGRGRIVHYYTGFDKLPGQTWGDENLFSAGHMDWADIPGGVMMRYGSTEPSDADFNSGSGQHVGTADQIVRRLQSALYYIGSHWPDAPRGLSEAAEIDPIDGADICEIRGGCDFTFTDSRGRSGPVSVNFPPGYSNKKAQDKRYPVVYMLHGYGQTPEDLKAAIVFLRNWMNSPVDSSASRLPEAILVYVDGRCRPNASGEESECIRGTFFTDSVREKGPKIESWWMELVDEIDTRYRTMPETTIEWTE